MFAFIERYTEIERENRILLEKMTNILQKQRGNFVAAPPMAAGKTSYMTSMYDSSALQPNSSSGPRRSLNRDARKRELMKITKENQMILKRLQDKSANYNVSRW